MAFISSLAGAMKTVPRYSVNEALVAVPLPVLAIIVGGLRLRDVSASRGSVGSHVAAALPVLIAVLTLLFTWGTYWFQPSRPR